MIARAIAKEMGIDDAQIIKYALEHDLDEVLSGDIPSPAKKMFGLKVPQGGKNNADCVNKQIVKMADLIEAVWFIKEAGIGRHADIVAGRLDDELRVFTNTTSAELRAAAKKIRKNNAMLEDWIHNKRWEELLPI